MSNKIFYFIPVDRRKTYCYIVRWR